MAIKVEQTTVEPDAFGNGFRLVQFGRVGMKWFRRISFETFETMIAANNEKRLSPKFGEWMLQPKAKTRKTEETRRRDNEEKRRREHRDRRSKKQ